MKKITLILFTLIIISSISFAEEPLINNVNFNGEVHLGFGISGDDVIFQRANYDLNERNFRLLSSDQLNNRENTYDPAIFNRLKFDIDATPESSPFSMHTKISIDPWSFTAKSPTFTVGGTGGDFLEIEYLFWANSGYTVNQNILTLNNGDGVSLPELKATGGRVLPTTLTSSFNNTFNVPEAELNYTFQPVREFWFDYQPSDTFKARIFPIAFEDQALNSDDPLKLSNNKIYWEESPWLASWKPGNLNSGGPDFTKGEWDDSLSFFTRDSDGTRLTALRGVSFSLSPLEETTIDFVAASPKTLWQDYERFSAVPASLRIKHFVDDHFYIGTTTNTHLGINDRTLDAYNNVFSFDTGYEFTDNTKIESQISYSETHQDLTNETYESQRKGNAYYAAITSTNIEDSRIIRKDYNALRPLDERINFYKTRLFYARMDENFESSLSNYRETRDDSYWSRHLNFRHPQDRFFAGGDLSFSLDDIQPFAIGNGIDYGRHAIGWRTNASILEGDLDILTDFRHVRSVENEYIETVARAQIDHQTTEKLTTKLLLLRHDLPNTTGGFDPYIVDNETQTGTFITNAAIPDDKDPSADTVSLGANYSFTDWLDVNGIWEYTNDFNAGSDNFPRGLLNSSSFTTFSENGLTYRRILPFLYSQTFFDLPPYDHHHVFKLGMNVQPNEYWNVYIDHTTNPNKFAGQIDDNINHTGIEITYLPSEQLGFFIKYTYSRWNDINANVFDSTTRLETFHNVYAEVRYNVNQDNHLSLQYGVGPSPTIATNTFDPFGGSLLTLDTQHIIRVRYEMKF